MSVGPEQARLDAAALEAPASLLALPGVGPARAARLRAGGIASVRDLLLRLPARVELFPAALPIGAARARRGEVVVVAGEVRGWRFSRFGRRSLLRVELGDESGALDVLFFNQPWLRERFARGERVEVRGRVVDAKGPALAALRLGTADRPLPSAGSVAAQHAGLEGLSPELLGDLAAEAARRHADALDEPLEPGELARVDVPPLAEAVRTLHAPRDLAAFARARRRVLLEPLLALQARLAARDLDGRGGRARPLVLDEALRDRLASRFPFELTRAQREAIEALRRDLARAAPMRRLLQGDVGSGKTAVGAWACLAAAACGAQAAFMAPTELLAEQHHAGLAGLLDAAGVSSALLTGSLAPATRRATLARAARGGVDVLFGTHALFSDEVRFACLALAVIDEQQRFGVAQRRRLLGKGRDVHALLMTATPIPRSLALTLYGDLEVTLLREKPPGRGRVRTKWLRGPKRRALLGWLDQRLEAGGQAYWVVPRIDGEAGAEGAEQRYARLAQGPLARHGLELVHGRQDPDERELRLARFRAGEARLLVATTVIEVGVDVPAASVMVIEQAQRLGLAQLHQLRGRVGRGAGEAWCLLLGARAGAERFELLEACDDGFRIAEEDLRRRGMGDLVGLRQAGLGALGATDLEADLDLLLLAREATRARPELRERYLRRARVAPGP